MSQPSLFESVVGHIPSWDELRNMTTFTLLNYTNYIMLVSFVIFAIFQAKRNVDKARALPKHSALPAPDFPAISELEGFELKTAEPIKLRPFKPKYYITMADTSALESLDPIDLLLMDRTYSERIQHRRQILQTHPSIALGVHHEPRIRPAVCELYTFLTGTYLPLRYPSMFTIHHTEFGHGKESVLQNLVTGEIVPTRPSSDAMPCAKLLDTLGRHVDEDFLLLLPEERGGGKRGAQKKTTTTTTTTVKKKMEDGVGPSEPKKQPEDGSGGGGAKYVLEAYVSCCPSGFNPAEKLGKKLRDIHGPVPGYAEKLEGSMDRYFANVEVGKYVKRVNWSVSMSAELFQPGLGSNHALKGEEVVEFTGELDPEQTLVRCERQTLHRLPKSKALVFAFKTYMYPIRQIKEEGLGEELAAAIDGLKEGNVPEMHFYKRGVEWGNAVKKYLRS